MKNYITAGATLLMTTTAAHAVGLDRSNQDITAIFEEGNYIELSFGSIMPNVGGADIPTPTTYDGVALDFTQLSGSLTYQINEQISMAVIIDQPFGVDILYPGLPATSMLGGTAEELNSTAITALARYRINENFSVHGGLRAERLDGNITLSGAAYGGLSGYNVDMASSTALGYVAGVAYERRDIALRVALTYNSSMTHEFDSVETVNGVPISALPAAVNPFGSDGIGVTTVETPESWNLDFQTGIAPDTLLFGSIRHAMYSQTLVEPEYFGGIVGSLTDIDDGTSYSIGVGRKFSESFSASVSYSWEAPGDDLVSPLSPTNGNQALSIGGQYTMGDLVLSGGIRYTLLGDAFPETGTPDVARADFRDNDVIAVGLSIGYNF
jgi:long-subunit fatty acid transport protein